MNSNMQQLGAMLSNRMKQTSNAAIPISIELGTVNANLSITPDSLRVPIPKGDYMVNYLLSGATTGAADEHSHTLPSLRAGNRILIAWCGNEPVVIAVVVSS